MNGLAGHLRAIRMRISTIDLLWMIRARFGLRCAAGISRCGQPWPRTDDGSRRFLAFPSTTHAVFDADVVIGSGSAGSPVAARLAEAFPRKTVLMLEAGISNNHPMVQCPFRMFDLIGSPFDWQYKTKPMPLADGRVMDWPRGKTLGGSSSINGILWVRNAKEDYDYWGNELGLEGWGWDDVLPYFIKMENVHGPSSEERGKEGPVDVTAFVKDQVNPCESLHRSNLQ